MSATTRPGGERATAGDDAGIPVGDGNGESLSRADRADGGLHVRPFRAQDTGAVVALWREAELTRPWNDPYLDVERRLAIDDGLFLVGTLRVNRAGTRDTDAAPHGTEPSREADAARAPIPDPTDSAVGETLLVASAMGGYEGHRGWVNYLAVHPAYRGRGHARALMDALESRLLARGCPKINLQVREDNRAALAFYERLGYAVDRSVSLGKRLIADD